MPLKLAKIPKPGHSDMEEKAEEVAELLAAMANPSRLLILCALVDGEKSVTELIAKTNSSQSAVSQHLGKLRLQGLVATRRDGQTIFYRLASREVTAVLETLYKVFCKN